MADDRDQESDTDSLTSLLIPVVEDPTLLRIAVIADPEVALGFLLAGIGYHGEKFRNYMMVESDTPQKELETFFNAVYRRSNMGIIIIDYDTAARLRTVISSCNQWLPVVITVPSKDSLGNYLDSKERKRRLRQRDAY